jgi:DNA modification methylase
MPDSAQLEHLPLASLTPYARNARTHSPAQITQLVASIKEFGFTNPVLIDAQGGIIAGHGRVLAAQQVGMATVPCLRLGHLTETQKRAYIIADNKLALNAGWDMDLLAQEMAALAADAFDTALMGFEDDEIAALLAQVERLGQPENNQDPDEVPEVAAIAISQPGDIWLLGKHRLLCGDSTKAEDVARVMGGEKADAVVTDPPYGIAHNLDYTRFTGGVADTQNRTKGVLANDDKPFDPAPFLDYKSVVIWGGNCFSNRLPMGTWLVWDKRFKNGTAFLSDAEVAWMKGGHGVYIFALTSQGFVRPEKVQHPTQKPVALIEWCIEKSKAGNVIFEPFSGSGTTLIACENLKRHCRAIEISPAYVDVAVKRWQTFTGQTARHAVTNRPFSG